MVRKLFSPITINIPVDKIYSRLGYAKGLTNLIDHQKNEFQLYIEEALSLVGLKGIAVRLLIVKMDAAEVKLEGDVVLKGSSLASLLENCSEVLFIGATAGSNISEAISQRVSRGDLTSSVVFDAVASEMTDASLDWIVNCCNRQLRRENKQLTENRFSAGYGDFLLDNQKIICNILKVNTIGVTLNNNCMLIPEKSVTAVVGIR